MTSQFVAPVSDPSLYPPVSDRVDGKPFLPEHLLRMSLYAKRSKGMPKSELLDTRIGVPNFRAMQLAGGCVFPWTKGMDVQSIPGRIHSVVIDLVGATYVDKVSNSRAGFDVVRAAMRALISEGSKLATSINLASIEALEAEYGFPIAQQLKAGGAFKVGNDQIALVIFDAQDQELPLGHVVDEMAGGFPFAFGKTAQQSNRKLQKQLADADVHMAMRWGAASVSLRSLMSDPEGQASFVDKISLVRAGSRAKFLHARAEAACVVGPGLISPPGQSVSEVEVGTGLWRNTELSISGGALNLIGDFAVAAERSGSLQALRSRGTDFGSLL